MKKRVLFYSSVKTKRMFSIQKFYRTDIQILRDLGFKVKLSNSALDYLAFWKYEIAFIYFYKYGLIPALFAKLFNKKVFFSGGIDNLDRENVKRKDYILQKLFFRLCNLFSNFNILVSNAERDNILFFYPNLNLSKSPVSFHVIDFDSYCYDYSYKKEKLIVTIAWMIREENVFRKGVDKSIRVFNELHKKDPDYTMIIIGPNGPGTLVVKDLIKSLDLGSSITLTDSLPELEKIKILKRSKFYLQLSTYEGFGIAAIEALASGNIVIHSGKGGLMDAIGNNGIIIQDLDDFEKTADIIIELQKLNSSKSIEKGIEYVRSNFKYEKRLKDFEKILIAV